MRWRGFTLIEVVAALALTGLVLLTLAGAYFTLSRSLGVMAAADAGTRERAVYRRLRADLEVAYVSRSLSLPSFTGEPDRLSFAARLGPTGLARVEYLPGSDGLLRRVTPLIPGWEETGDIPGVRRRELREATLLGPEQAATLRYMGRNGGWSTRWSGEVEGGLPTAVEVTLDDASGRRSSARGRSWIFPLHVGGLPPGGESR